MKKISLMVVLLTLLGTSVEAQSWLNKEKEPEKSRGWLDNFEQAKKEAKEHKQPIFAFFTGSDWCGWCVKLKKEVLDTKEFQSFAADNMILFEADFPRQKKINDKVKKQNAELQKQYGVRGYPTVFLLDAEGKQVGRTGYKAGGGEAYVKHLQELFKEAKIEVSAKGGAAKNANASLYEKMKAEREKAAQQAAPKDDAPVAK